MIAWRLCKKKQAPTALSGKGASEYPGRWNHKGEFVVYLGESRALASLEVLAHVEDRSLLNAIDWVVIPVEIDDALIAPLEKLPDEWHAMPSSAAAAQTGSDWYRSKSSAVLRVPSVVVKGESNYLINATHPDAIRVQPGNPEPFTFDPRIAR